MLPGGLVENTFGGMQKGLPVPEGLRDIREFPSKTVLPLGNSTKVRAGYCVCVASLVSTKKPAQGLVWASKNVSEIRSTVEDTYRNRSDTYTCRHDCSRY